MATAKKSAEQVVAEKAKTTITIPGRFSYVSVFEPKSSKGGKPKYQTAFLIPKTDSVSIEKIKAAQEAAKVIGIATLGGSIPEKLKVALRDGDEEKDLVKNPEFKGHMFINASSETKPGIVDVNRQEILNSTAFYSGCYGKLNCNFYAFNFEGSKGIACGLNHVMKTADGEALGGRISIDDAFEDDSDDIAG